jgi:Sec-independent protein translocase protein TatA
MEGTKNINKKLLINTFTTLFLIGFIYSVYSQATSAQNNAAISSLESNAIIQEIVSLINSYLDAGQSLASFLSINAIPSYVWAIIIFLITTLFFVAIYIYLFEIFIQRAKISENETMKKAKILFIFALSVFSALAIGYAIPFLLNLYGLILLILVIIALFFFGRAAISYGKSFHHSIKSFAADIEKEFLKAEKELKQAKKEISEQDVKFLEEGREKIHKELEDINNRLSDADKKFETTLSKLEHAYKDFINDFINRCESYFNSLQNRNLLSPNQIAEKDNFINKLGQKMRDTNRSEILNSQKSPKDLFNEILNEIDNLKDLNNHKPELKKLLNASYIAIFHSQVSQHNQIFNDIQDTINEYKKVKTLLIAFNGLKDSFKRDIQVRFRHLFHAPDSRKYDIAILSTLNKSDKYIKEIEKLVDERIQLLEKLLH